MSNNQNLKSFISKLNDRNLQRKRESGITSYGLYSLLLFCSYKLYKNLSFYLTNFEPFNLTDSIHLICYISNSLIAIHIIISIFNNKKKIFSNLNIIKYQKETDTLLDHITSFFLFIIPVSTTIYSFLNIPNSVNKYYYYCLLFLNSILVLIFIANLFKKEELKLHKKSRNNSTKFELFSFLISALVIISSIYSSLEINVTEKFIFIKIIIIFYCILYILEQISITTSNDINTINLESFEYEIYLKDLPDDIIRKKLQENYVGYLVEYWIDFNTKEFELLNTDIENKIKEIKSKLTKLNNNVNKQEYPIEHSGREDKITSVLTKYLNLKSPAVDKMFVDITKVMNDENSLSESEKNKLNTLASKIDKLQIIIAEGLKTSASNL